jgi:phosphate transport system protein
LLALETQLQNLNAVLLKMGGLVEEMIAQAVDALERQDVESARQVIDRDVQVDQHELLVDALSLQLLSQAHVDGFNLRLVTTAMLMAKDLERMADLAVDIAQNALEAASRPLVKPLIDIHRMEEIARRMLRDVLQAFVQRNVGLARRIYDDENEEDRLRDQVVRELTAIMVADGSTVPGAIPLLLTARQLERICDHATNIAEDIIFIVEGRVARHHPWMLEPPLGE